MRALDQVFQYRTLLGKCESGAGLSVEEIDDLITIEASFAAGPDDAHRDGRRFRRQPTRLTGLVRGGELNDRVMVAELAPGGALLRGAPCIDAGMAVELVVDDAAGGQSYRFRAVVRWCQAEADGHALGVALVGSPVCLHYGAIGHDEVVERIAA